MTRVKTAPLVLFVCLVFSTPFLAQDSDLPVAPAIRVNTRLVLLDVVVTDKHGQAISGLQSSDFTVEEKGKQQKITFFAPPGQNTKSTAPSLPPGVYSNRPEYRSPSGPPTVILLDAANTSVENQSYARMQMLKWVVNSIHPGDRVAVFALTNGLSVLCDFTEDPQVLHDVLEKYVSQKPAETATPAPPGDTERYKMRVAVKSMGR